MPFFGGASGLTISAVLAALNPAPIIQTGVTGAKTLAFASGALNTQFDVTMTGATAFTIDASAATVGSSMVVTFKGPYAWSIANAAIAYAAGGLAPSPQCSATKYDTVQITVQPDGTLLLNAVAIGASGASLSLNPFSTSYYGAATIPVQGSYTGAAPSNLDYSVDGGAWTTLSAGAATIIGGTFSFNVTGPTATGSHTIAVRATNATSIASATQSFTIAAPAAPTYTGASGQPQANQVILSIAGVANGAPITSITVQRAPASNGTFATVGTAAPATQPTSGNTTATYTDTGAVQGGYYQFIFNSSAGNTTSGIIGPVSPVAAPAHYLNLNTSASGTSVNANTSGNTAQDSIANSFLDIQLYLNPASWVFSSNVNVFGKARWQSGTSSSDTSWRVVFGTGNGSTTNSIGCETIGSGGTYSNYYAALPSSYVVNNVPIQLRVVINQGSAAVTDQYGVSWPAGSAAIFVATGTVRPTTAAGWTQIGTTTANMSQTGFKALGTGQYPSVCSFGSGTQALTGKFYWAYVWDGGGKLLYAPDFTQLSTGATSFQDTAVTPNTWSIASGASEA